MLKLEVLTALTMNITVYSDVMSQFHQNYTSHKESTGSSKAMMTCNQSTEHHTHKTLISILSVSLTAEPHDEHHLVGDLVFSEAVTQYSKWKDIASPANKTQYNAPHNQRRLHTVLKTEQRQTKICKDTSLSNKCQSTHCLLHGDLCHCGEVEVSVMGHDNATEQNCHDTCNNTK